MATDLNSNSVKSTTFENAFVVVARVPIPVGRVLITAIPVSVFVNLTGEIQCIEFQEVVAKDILSELSLQGYWLRILISSMMMSRTYKPLVRLRLRSTLTFWAGTICWIVWQICCTMCTVCIWGATGPSWDQRAEFLRSINSDALIVTRWVTNRIVDCWKRTKRLMRLRASLKVFLILASLQWSLKWTWSGAIQDNGGLTPVLLGMIA